MRPIDRDLIRGGHYGQRSCEPHQQAEHMAAPTNAALVKKVLANSEPSTHGPSRHAMPKRFLVAFGGIADIAGPAAGSTRSRMTQLGHYKDETRPTPAGVYSVAAHLLPRLQRSREFTACLFREMSLAQSFRHAIRIRLLCEPVEFQPIADCECRIAL